MPKYLTALAKKLDHQAAIAVEAGKLAVDRQDTSAANFEAGQYAAYAEAAGLVWALVEEHA